MILDWVFQSSGKRMLKKLKFIVDEVNKLEQLYLNMSQDEILEKINQWKYEVQNNLKTLDVLLPNVFALTREVAKRTIYKRHFDVQIIGGTIIHRGMIAEMKTGEGKTLVATLPAVLNALTGKTVYVITVNDYLAKRDCQLMSPIYKYLGLTVDYVTSTCNNSNKQRKYRRAL